MSQETQQDFMGPAEPQAEHRWLQRLVGKWNYEGQAEMGGGNPPETMRGASEGRAFGKLWVMIEDRGDPAEPEPRSNLFTFGYDPKKQRFTGTFVDSGSTYLWVYDGWLEGNVLTLESVGPAMSGAGMVTYRDSIEVVDDNHWVLRSQVPGEDGEWNQFMTSHYRRR